MDNTAAAEILETIAASALQMAGVLRGTAVEPGGELAADPATGPAATGLAATGQADASHPVPRLSTCRL